MPHMIIAIKIKRLSWVVGSMVCIILCVSHVDLMAQVYVVQNGDVGIGLATPSDPLSVNGRITQYYPLDTDLPNIVIGWNAGNQNMKSIASWRAKYLSCD